MSNDSTPGSLGRHVEHNPESRAYAIEPKAVTALRTVRHQRHVPIFDQDVPEPLGSCTGNAAAGCMATGPWSHPTNEQVAIELYSRATHLDRAKGVYPPDDTGSSGLAVMKAVKEKGWISAYHHAFSMHAALTALQATPVILGIPWYESFDQPGRYGMVTIAGAVRGGHEVCIEGLDVVDQTVLCANSWSSSWGLGGRFVMTWATFDELLHQQGDVTVPVA